MVVEALDRLGAPVAVVLEDAARPKDVVGDDEAALRELRQHVLVVGDVALLVRVDEGEVERAVHLAEQLDRLADAVIDPVGDAGFLGVPPRDCGRLLVHVQARDPPALGEVERHRDRGVAREGADLEHVARAGEPDEPAEKLALERADHHLRHGGGGAGLLLEPAEEVRVRRRVLDRVALDLLGEEAHCTRPSKTHALWPPRPIAFESATSTSASRASLGT